MVDDNKKTDGDEGWWYRGMSRRAQYIVVITAGVLVVGGLIWAVASGARLF